MADPSAHKLFSKQLAVRFSLKYYPQNVDHKHLDIEKLPLNFDTSHPERNVADIKESEDLVNLIEEIIPNKHILDTHPERELALLKSKLYNTEKKLEKTRKRMEQIRSRISKEWKDMEEKETQLRENFILFDKFVHENSEKRIRASKRIEEEKQMIQTREEQKNELGKKIDEMIALQALMEKRVKNLKMYKDFLDEVIKLGDFKTVQELLNRFHNLRSSSNMLSGKHKDNLDILEKAKSVMMKLIEEKNFVIMGLNNQIANLQARYENANIKALESEGLVTQIKNNAVKQLGEIDTVKNSIWNVYVHMAMSKKHPIKIKKDNVEEQMMYINRTLTELSKVNKLIKKRASKMK